MINMNYRAVLRALGMFLCFLAATMLIPLAWSLGCKTPDWKAFLISMFVTGLPGILLARLPGGSIGSRESYLIVTGGWVLCALAGGLPFLLAGSCSTLPDAFFEAMSGFTTTGATILTDVESQPPGILFWRSQLHWLGGMGIIVVFLALIPRMEPGGSQLFQAEVPGIQVRRFKPKIRETARTLLIIYSAMTLLQTVLLMLAGLSLFESLVQSFGTVATGGFSTRARSYEAFGSVPAEIITTVFMFAAGVNFTLYFRLFSPGERKAILKDQEFKVYAAVTLIFTLVLSGTLLGTYSPSQAFRHGSFQVVSITTTTGYASADFNTWPEISKALLLILMFVGASTGSTAGSIKVARWMIIVKHAYREIYRFLHPRAVLPVRQDNKGVPENIVSQVLAFSAIYVGAFLLGWLIMLGLGLDLVSAASAVAATLGDVGPGLGSVGPMANYALIPGVGKMVLSFLMLIGRLEIFSVLVILTPGYWNN